MTQQAPQTTQPHPQTPPAAPAQTSAQGQQHEHEDEGVSPFLDGVWYDAHGVLLPSNDNLGLTMGQSGTDGDQVVWDLVVDPANGTKPLSRQLFCNMSTDAGLSILAYHAKYLGCGASPDIADWKVDPTIIVSVLFETEEYPANSGVYRQRIKKLIPKRPKYERKIVQQKASTYRDKIAIAQRKNAEYEQDKALGKMSGSGSRGRSNELPPETGAGSERDDFNRSGGANGAPAARRQRF